MPPPFVSEINRPRIAAMSFSYCVSQTFRFLRHSYQMDMVAHQTIGPYFHAMQIARCRHQSNVFAIVTFIKKCLLSSVASLRNMMRHFRNDYSCYSGHEQFLNNGFSPSIIKYTVPRIMELWPCYSGHEQFLDNGFSPLIIKYTVPRIPIKYTVPRIPPHHSLNSLPILRHLTVIFPLSHDQ